MGHAALARARLLPHLRRAVDRGAARVDRRVHRTAAEALRRHAAPDLRVLRARLRQRPRPAGVAADEPDPRPLRRSRTTTSSTCSRRWSSSRSAGTRVTAGGRRRERRQATFHFWHEVGREWRSGIPGDLRSLERFNVDFERERFEFTMQATASPSRRATCSSTGSRDCRSAWGGRLCTRCSTRRCSMRSVSRIRRRPCGAPSRARRAPGHVSSLPCPRAGRPRYRTLERHRSYPDGYEIEALGPPDPAYP